MNIKSTLPPYDKRNLRPIILVTCFIWGLCLGFFMNFFREINIENPKSKKETIVSENNTTKPLVVMPEVIRREEGLPTIAPVEENLALVLDNQPILRFEEKIPDLPLVNIDINYGLTGTTAIIEESIDTIHNRATPKPSKSSSPPLIIDLEPF